MTYIIGIRMDTSISRPNINCCSSMTASCFNSFWWYSSPPLLKLWFDEVLTFGWAYGPGGASSGERVGRGRDDRWSCGSLWQRRI